MITILGLLDGGCKSVQADLLFLNFAHSNIVKFKVVERKLNLFLLVSLRLFLLLLFFLRKENELKQTQFYH